MTTLYRHTVRGGLVSGLAALFIVLFAVNSHAVISGITSGTPGTPDAANFNLTAKSAHIDTADGNSVYMWGYSDNNGSGTMQYPGPTIIVDEGDTVTITLTNSLTRVDQSNPGSDLPMNEPISIIFPGQEGVTATGGDQDGVLTREALQGGTVTYTFTATRPGTFIYQSGSHMDLQVEMGLFGALIVRPTMGADHAYNHADTVFTHEYLFVLSEVDFLIHELVEQGRMSEVDNTTAFPVYWFVNGRVAPDTLFGDNYGLLPFQPYGSLVRTHPGERVLMRVVGAGRDFHPFHHHGNSATIIAKDSRLLTTGTDKSASSPDLGHLGFTIASAPGQTADAIFVWTGQELGWDFYGHTMNTPPTDPTKPWSEFFATTTLGAGIAPGDTSLTVAATDGARFPHTHPFRAIIWESTLTTPESATNREVVTMTWDRGTPGGDTFLIKRAREGSSALTHVSGANIAMTDHGKAFPVTLPNLLDLTFGGFYSGSPFLGVEGPLPVGEGGLNPSFGFFFMWHSHTEKELTNFDIFPGGMLTQLIIEHPSIPIP